jgi:hypothetical protein
VSAVDAFIIAVVLLGRALDHLARAIGWVLRKTCWVLFVLACVVLGMTVLGRQIEYRTRPE